MKLIKDLDSDGDGSLSADEISTAINNAGGTTDASTISSLLTKLDSSGDGLLSTEELGSAIDKRLAQLGSRPPPGRPPPSASDIASNLISEVDTNGDGSLGLDEIKSALSQTDQASQNDGSSDTLAQAVSKLDTNGDGVLSAEELSKAIEQSFAQMVSSAYDSAQKASNNTSELAKAA